MGSGGSHKTKIHQKKTTRPKFPNKLYQVLIRAFYNFHFFSKKFPKFFVTRYRLSFSEADLQLVVGADDLKSIERDIHLFQQNDRKFHMIVTSPSPKLTGAIRFGAGKICCVDGKNQFLIVISGKIDFYDKILI